MPAIVIIVASSIIGFSALVFQSMLLMLFVKNQYFLWRIMILCHGAQAGLIGLSFHSIDHKKVALSA